MLQNFDPYRLWSEIVLINISLVSNKAAVGDAVSWGYSSWSPPTVIRTLYISFLKGHKSHTKLA